MKVKCLIATSLGLLLALLTVADPTPQPRKIDVKRAFMRQKLECSQNILEGLLFDQFDLVISNAVNLRTLSVATNNWTLLDYPSYSKYAKQLQSDSDVLIQAARAQNSAECIAAYHSIINDCAACHSSVAPQLMYTKITAPRK